MKHLFKSLFLLLLLPLVVNGQTYEQSQYINEFNKISKDLYVKAKQYYDKEVAPVQKQLKAIPAERSAEEVSQLQDSFKVVKDELYKLQYEEYIYSLRMPLEALKAELERNGWRKLNRGSEALKRFDNDWNNSAYLQFLTSTEGVGYSQINETVSKVTDLRLRCFDDCQRDLDDALLALAPSSYASTFDIIFIRSQIKEKTQILDKLSATLNAISKENEQFNALEQQRYYVVEKWYDQREELDKKLLDACKFCLSAPYDNKGAYKWMLSQVAPKLDSVFHKSYRERRDKYRILLDGYDKYTAEVEDFLNLVFVYVKSGQMTEARKNEIASSLQSLDYYKQFYVNHDEEKAVTSPYIDGIITDFEKMLNSNFEDGVGKYTELTERLRGNQQYYAQLDEGNKKRAEDERKEKERARFIKEGKLKETFVVNGVKFTMVRVNGGTFTMGATAEQGSKNPEDEKPAHRVTLSTYYIGQTEVTKELWEAVMGKNPNNGLSAKGPATDVSWNDCQEFIKKLNQLTGKNFRLPTEAEWEYAARGGNRSKGYKYSGGNEIREVAWYGGSFFGNTGGTCNVADKLANELGLYDMSGNVSEWCQDWYGSYSSETQIDPRGPSSGSYRVYRGGDWSDDAESCRVATRHGGAAGFNGRWSSTNSGYIIELGLRLAL